MHVLYPLAQIYHCEHIDAGSNLLDMVADFRWAVLHWSDAVAADDRALPMDHVALPRVDRLRLEHTPSGWAYLDVSVHACLTNIRQTTSSQPRIILECGAYTTMPCRYARTCSKSSLKF